MKYNKPSPDKYINYHSEMGSNGQYDEIGMIHFFEDNPEYEDKEYATYENILQLYENDLQENYERAKQTP